MSWSVRWTLMESAIPAEIARLADIFPEDPPELIERHARYDKSRSFDTRVKADWHIKSLKKQRIASSIVLRHFDPKGNDRTGMFWEIPQPHYAMSEDPFKLISGTTQDGQPFHQIDVLLIQRNRNGEWHGFDRTIWQTEFPSEKSALRWLKNNAPKAPKLLPPRFGSITTPQPVTPQQEKVNTSSPTSHFSLLTSHSAPPSTMKSNLTPESDFASSLASSSLASCVSDFSFRRYQREDLARSAMHDGAVIGWEPGMGKTMAIFSLPFLKHSRFALIVAPDGLHEQIMDEGREKFGVEVTPIPNQAAAYRLMRDGILPLPGHQSPVNGHQESSPLTADRSTAAPLFFITSYTALGYNGADEWHVEETNELLRGRRLTILCANQSFPDPELAKRMAAMTWDPKKKSTSWEKLSLPEGASEESIRTALKTATRLFHPSLHGGDATMHWRFQAIANAACTLLEIPSSNQEPLLESLTADPLLLSAQEALATIEKGIGTEREIVDHGSQIVDATSEAPSTIHNPQSSISIKCVFQPTLASLLCHIFDCVICDEAVRVKSGTSYQAQGVLRMSYARSRYLLTGTPIKNKLPDLFFLASFVTGHSAQARARWPYGNDTADRYRFASDFGVMEENLTKGEQAQKNGKRQPPPKTTNQICNVHRLWRILLPVIIRRRKDDVEGCDIPPKTIVPIRVMPGTHQQRAYKYALNHPEPKASLLATIGAQLQCLRQAALNPSTSKLRKESRSPNPWTPKAAGIFQLATDLMAQGEQLVIFSPFQDFSALLATRFAEAGIPCLRLDGNTSGSKRGSQIKKFKSGEIPILIAGIDSMGEGHSLDNCCHLVLPSLSWAFDSNSQAVDRVHRLTSKKPVTIYVMVTKGTIDERLASIWQEKGDSSDLALDGRLTTQDRDEIDLGQLLRDAVEDFDPLAETLDEDQVSTQWKSTLCPALSASYKSYRKARPIKAQEPKTQDARPPAKSPSSPSTSHSALPTSHSPQPRPTSLFDLMKQKRNQPPTPPPAAPESSLPTSHSALGTPPNIIPFPGALGRLTAKTPIENRQSQIDNPKSSPPFRRVSIAEILRS